MTKNIFLFRLFCRYSHIHIRKQKRLKNSSVAINLNFSPEYLYSVILDICDPSHFIAWNQAHIVTVTMTI